ncbi:MAG TPA: hypothetical protein EYQ14_18755 [Gammaproteobacteria bacterium]|nr:hypothetical protein [Gammaproteobacteria bacterium]HIL98524.1 hypothetical protein [Pseudomonadales bacterium]
MTPTRDEIENQLKKLLSNTTFVNSIRISRFLQFVVEQALAGEAGRLKEYVIGVEVFDRDEQYDPRIDSIVRVEAGRLRAKLQDYYTSHSEDVVIIELPKGGYSPRFVMRDSRQPLPQQDQIAVGLPVTFSRFIALSIALMVILGIMIAAWRIDVGTSQAKYYF